jgi:hypothetical protein
MKRTLRICYDDGRSVGSRREVYVFGQGGRCAHEQTDSSGTIYFEWDDRWINSVSLDGKIIKSDWSLGGSGLGASSVELTIPRD